MFTEEANREAAKQLCVPSDWIIVHQSVQAAIIDSDDVTQYLELEEGGESKECSYDEVFVAVEKSICWGALPAGWRMVGMRAPDNVGGELKCGIVDLSSLGTS